MGVGVVGWVRQRSAWRAASQWSRAHQIVIAGYMKHCVYQQGKGSSVCSSMVTEAL